MKVLFLCDDLWHPAEVIERGLAAMEWPDIELDIVKDAKDILTPAMLERYEAIVVAKSNVINASNTHAWFEPGVTECTPEDLARYVENGGGLLALHAGVSFTRDDPPAYIDLVGAYFLGHPPREPVRFCVAAPHPITEGVADFCERDEPYQIAVTAPDVQPFLVSHSEHGGVFPSGFARAYGKGRVATLTPGHLLSVWENPNFQRLLQNAIRWCARKR